MSLTPVQEKIIGQMLVDEKHIKTHGWFAVYRVSDGKYISLTRMSPKNIEQFQIRTLKSMLDKNLVTLVDVDKEKNEKGIDFKALKVNKEQLRKQCSINFYNRYRF